MKLQKELDLLHESLDGHSYVYSSITNSPHEHRESFAMLARQGVIRSFNSTSGEYFYPTDTLGAYPRNVAFRIPTSSVLLGTKNLTIDHRGISVKKAGSIANASDILRRYILFLNEWIMKSPEIDSIFEKNNDIQSLRLAVKEKIAVMIYHYGRTEGVISVPQFLFKELIRSILNITFSEGYKEHSLIYEVLDEEPIILTCPLCRHRWIKRGKPTIVRCEKCNQPFTSRN